MAEVVGLRAAEVVRLTAVVLMLADAVGLGVKADVETPEARGLVFLLRISTTTIPLVRHPD